MDRWLREVAPSDELRKRFSHDPARWEEFRQRYREELKGKEKELLALIEMEKEKGTITLLFAALDREHNNAVVLSEVLRRRNRTA